MKKSYSGEKKNYAKKFFIFIFYVYGNVAYFDVDEIHAFRMLRILFI